MSTNTANMGLPLSTVNVDSGLTWEANLNQALTQIDSHDHSFGFGVPIQTNGININADFPINNNNLVLVRSVRFQPQNAVLSGPLDVGCIYSCLTNGNFDLFYNDTNGNKIQITSNGSVTGASGTITGLPSGTASAAFVSGTGTFVFQQATSTGANLDVASIAIRYPGSYPTPTGNFVQLRAPSSLATGYNITFPPALSGANGSLLTMDTAGMISYTNADNATIVISGGALSVANAGISTAQLANGSVTNPKLASLNIQISASAGGIAPNSSSSFQTFTGSTITITTSGRPVFIGLIGDQAVASSSPAFVFCGSSSCQYRIVDGSGTVYLLTDLTGTIQLPPFSFSVILALPAGTYTGLTFQARTVSGGGDNEAANIRMIAYEI